MFSPQVHPIRESSNDDPFHHHGGNDATSDNVSNIYACNTTLIGGVASLDVDVVAPVGGATTAKWGLRPNSSVCENPLPNVIYLDLEATIVHIIVPRPFILLSPPLRKPSKAKKVFPLVVLLGYTWVHREVNS